MHIFQLYIGHSENVRSDTLEKTRIALTLLIYSIESMIHVILDGNLVLTFPPETSFTLILILILMISLQCHERKCRVSICQGDEERDASV